MQPKRIIRRQIEALRAVDRQLESIRDHFDMEWGENENSDVDLALTSVISNLAEARNRLDDVLLKFRGRSLRPNYPRKRVPAKSYSLKDLPLVF